MKFSTGLAILGSVSVAISVQPHGHVHRHVDKHAAAHVDRRADVTTWVPGPTETIYELDGTELTPAQVSKGLEEGIYVLISDTSSATPTPSAAKPAEFFEKSSSKKPKPTPKPVSTSKPPPAPSTPAAPVVPAVAPAPPKAPAPSVDSAPSSGSGVDKIFVSGTVPCSHFPSEYGAVAAAWLGLDGWTGVQQVPGYTPGSSSISDIVTAVAGMGGCTPNSFCSYACPAGYQKVHWPTVQGATGQSIGGLLCNSAGMLELTNPAFNTLCGSGTGEVKVTNNLSQEVCICRTDYPGTESETVALVTEPGQTYELTCPDASHYYMWGGKPTSAQYYINPAGVPVDQACIWGNGGSQTGNWAPINLGVGKGITGETFISMFFNKPTNPNPSLDYTIEIQGDISGSCKYSGGTFYSNGVPSSSGCTVSVQGVATYVLS